MAAYQHALGFAADVFDTGVNHPDISIATRWRLVTYRWWLPIAIVVVLDHLRQVWGGAAAPLAALSLVILATAWLGTWLFPQWTHRWGDRIVSLAVLVPLLAGGIQAGSLPDPTLFTLLQTLAFWAPLVGVYWAMAYFDRPPRAVALTICLYGCLAVADHVVVLQGGRSFLNSSLHAFLFQGVAALGIIVIFAITHRHVTALTDQRDSARGDAAHDPLTGLFNRRHFTGELERAVARSRRHHCALSLMMVDLDNFKGFNDRRGHSFGDLVLKQVAAVLDKRARNCDVICRWGGEEFALILPDTTIEQATHLAESVRTTIAALELSEGERATASFGIAEFSSDEAPLQLFERADCAVQLAKLAGRNQTKYCRARMASPCDGAEPRCCDPGRSPAPEACGANRVPLSHRI